MAFPFVVIVREDQRAGLFRMGRLQGGRAEVDVPFIAADADGPKHFQVGLDRDQLGKILQDARKLA